MLDDDDPLALVSPCEHDGNGAGLQAGPDPPDVAGEEVLGGGLGGFVSGRVVGGGGQLINPNHPGAAVLRASDLLFDEGGFLQRCLFGRLLLQELVYGLFVVGLGAAEPHHTRFEVVVAGLPFVPIICHLQRENRLPIEKNNSRKKEKAAVRFPGATTSFYTPVTKPFNGQRQYRDFRQ